MGSVSTDVLELATAGDQNAFRELVDQYKGLVFGLIARSISNRARAEELAQDVFLKEIGRAACRERV